MPTATTPEAIASAKKFAESLLVIPGVNSSIVDDWGSFSNFRLFVSVANNATVDLRSIRTAMKRALKTRASGAHLRSVVMPRRIYASGAFGRRRFVGWDSDGRRYENEGVISIDLDFHEFDHASNSFPAVQPSGPFKLGAWGVPA